MENKLYQKFIREYYNSRDLQMDHEMKEWIQKAGSTIGTLVDILDEIRKSNGTDITAVRLKAANALLDMNK